MGTKLSKANAKEGGAKEVVTDKSATLPPAITEKKETDENLAAKSETLPRNAFDRSSSFSKRFRKSMTKFVGKKKGNKEAPEEKVEKATEEATAEQINIEQEKEGDFKSTQQKARADFFKEMYTADEKIDVVADVEKEENNVESEDKETKNEEDEKLNVSLIGTPELTHEEELKKTPVEEENLPEKIVEEEKQEIKIEDADDELPDWACHRKSASMTAQHLRNRPVFRNEEEPHRGRTRAAERQNEVCARCWITRRMGERS